MLVKIFFGWAWSKMGVASLITGSKIDCTSEMNRWNKLIFFVLAQIQVKTCFSDFWVGMVKNDHGLLVH